MGSIGNRDQAERVKDPGNLSLNEWVNFFGRYYKEANREKGPMELWLQAVDETSKLTEAVRRNEPLEAIEKAVKLFGWVCAFVGKYTDEENAPSDEIGGLLLEPDEDDFIGGKESYEKWILLKYPGVCCFCGKRYCGCPTYRHLIEARKTYPKFGKGFVTVIKEMRSSLGDARKDMSTLQRLLGRRLDDRIDDFAEIYGGPHFDLDWWKTSAKLLEEVGEAARDILSLVQLKHWKDDLESGNPQQKEQAKSALDDVRKTIKRTLREALKAKKDISGKDKSEIKKRFSEHIKDVEEHFRELPDNEFIDELRCCAAKGLKGELADVFSWLAGFLHKIGESWRAHRVEKGQEQQRKRRYQFYEFICAVYHCKDGREKFLVCYLCGEDEGCRKTCLWEATANRALRKKGNDWIEKKLIEDLARI